MHFYLSEYIYVFIAREYFYRYTYIAKYLTSKINSLYHYRVRRQNLSNHLTYFEFFLHIRWIHSARYSPKHRIVRCLLSAERLKCIVQDRLLADKQLVNHSNSKSPNYFSIENLCYNIRPIWSFAGTSTVTLWPLCMCIKTCRGQLC